jgi:hypothetical protein
MRRHRPFVRQTFSSLSNHQQRDLYVRLRSKIKQTQSIYSPLFTSHVLIESDRQPIGHQWMDLYFLGLDGRTIWNTTLRTANQAYWDAVDDLARDQAEALCPYALADNPPHRWFQPVYGPTGRLLHYVMPEAPKEVAFGGLTRFEFMRQRASTLIQKDAGDMVQIHEQFDIDRGYAYGIGLHAVIDVPSIDVQAIDAFIQRFRSMGELPWRCEAPVPRLRLPSDTLEVLWRAGAAG